MKGFYFYEEFLDTQRTLSAGRVVAVATTTYHAEVESENEHEVEPEVEHVRRMAILARTNEPNAAVGAASVNATHLNTRCRRIAESRAREIHPRLFRFIEG